MSNKYETHIPDAAILDEKETDFRFGDAVTLRERLDRARKPNPNYIYSWNQAKYRWSRNFCTAVGTMCAILTYREMERSDEEWRDFRDRCAENYDYVSNKWHKKSTGNEAAAKYWNAKYPDKEMLFFNTRRLSEDYRRWLSFYYDACVGYRGNSSWNADRMDWVLDNAFHWESTYWHIRRDRALDKDYIRAIDNYKDRMIDWQVVNDYKIPRENLPLLRINSWMTWYYPTATFFVPLYDISDLPLDRTKYFFGRLRENSKMRNEANSDPKLSDKTKLEIQEFLHQQSSRIRAKFVRD